MEVGELFIKLGLDDEHQVVKGLKRVDEGFKSVWSSSLQAKVGIAAALYGLERITSKAADTGSRLYKFREAFGLSTKELQKWQHWARRFGAENEIQGAIEGIQKAVTEMELGGGIPEAFARLNIKTQGQDAFQILAQIEQKLKNVSPRLGQWLVKGIGINTNLFQALRSMNRAADKVPKSEILSRGQIDRLQALNVAWSQFRFNLQRAGELAAGDFGGPMIKGLERLTTLLVDTSTGLKNTAKLFPSFSMEAAALGAALTAAFGPLGGLLVILTKIQELRELEEKPGQLADWAKTIPGQIAEGIAGVVGDINKGTWDFATRNSPQQSASGVLQDKNMFLPSRGPTPAGPSTTNNDQSKKTTVYVQEVKLPQSEADKLYESLSGPISQLVGIK